MKPRKSKLLVTVVILTIMVLSAYRGFEEGIYKSKTGVVIRQQANVLSELPDLNLGLSMNSLVTSDQLCFGKGIKPVFPTPGKTPLSHLDFRQEKFEFLDNFKNPCFYRNVTFYNNKPLKTPVRKLRCLPYFYIIGMPKSGTTDIWYGLNLHPGVVAKHWKEQMYFNRCRFPRKNWTLDQYLDKFDKTVEKIASSPSPDMWIGEKNYFHQITGEATVDISHENDWWYLVPGNEDCNEPRVLNSHYLHHLNPQMKLIMILRNPIDRVFSDYLYEARFLGYEKSLHGFHQAVLESIGNHTDCQKYFTERGCAYNASLEAMFKARLRVGMYHVFLEDWFRVFPRDQIMVIQFEEFTEQRVPILKKIFKFLDLRPILLEEERTHEKRKVANTKTKKDRELGDMMPETRKILEEFYAPFNKRLSSLLNDNKYLWKK